MTGGERGLRGGVEVPRVYLEQQDEVWFRQECQVCCYCCSSLSGMPPASCFIDPEVLLVQSHGGHREHRFIFGPESQHVT